MDKIIYNGNKLIADFEGREYRKDITSHLYSYRNDLIDYSDDWNLLMPIVKKIEDTAHLYCEIGTDVVYFRSRGAEDERRPYLNTFVDISIAISSHDTKIFTAWKAVVEFIEWYNQVKE